MNKHISAWSSVCQCVQCPDRNMQVPVTEGKEHLSRAEWKREEWKYGDPEKAIVG